MGEIFKTQYTTGTVTMTSASDAHHGLSSQSILSHGITLHNEVETLACGLLNVR